MKRNLSSLLQIVAVLFSASIPVNLAHAQAQLPPDAPLADQLKAQFKVTKFGLDNGGFAVLSPGTILVIQKGGILGVPPANLTMGVAIFKDGDLKQPSAGNRMFLGNVTRFLQVGEKVYVQKVDLNLKTDKLQFTVVECDSCNGVNQQSLFKGVVSFEFAKGSLATAEWTTIADAIAQVFTVDNGNDSNGQQQNQDQNAQQGQQQDQQQQAAPQQQAPPPEPASIQMGMTVDQVEAALGPPDKKVTIGAKIIYVYKDLKVTFTNGKVTDAQ
jgi:hypothetical protein